MWRGVLLLPWSSRSILRSSACWRIAAVMVGLLLLPACDYRTTAKDFESREAVRNDPLFRTLESDVPSEASSIRLEYNFDTDSFIGMFLVGEAVGSPFDKRLLPVDARARVWVPIPHRLPRWPLKDRGYVCVDQLAASGFVVSTLSGTREKPFLVLVNRASRTVLFWSANPRHRSDQWIQAGPVQGCGGTARSK